MNRKGYTEGGLLATTGPLGSRSLPLTAKELTIPPEDLRNRVDSDNWQVPEASEPDRQASPVSNSEI